MAHDIEADGGLLKKKLSMFFRYTSKEREPNIQLIMEGLHKDNAVTRVRTIY